MNIQIGDIVEYGNFYGIVVGIGNDTVSVQWFGIDDIDDIQRYYSTNLIKVSQ